VKYFLFIIVSFVLISVIYVNAAFNINEATQKWQTADSIKGVISSTERTLQYAFDNGLLINDEQSLKTLTDSSSLVGNQHRFGDIWIATKLGDEKKK